MDYFSQYTFAETSANMIGEIAYTETLTFWSTLISAPLAYFGSWAITAGIGKLAGEAGAKVAEAFAKLLDKSVLEGLLGTVVSPVKEVFQEIIEDGFIEAVVGNLVEIAGGSDDLGFWLSSIATSVRESGGALGQLALGGAVNLGNMVTLIQGRTSGMSMTDIRQQISQQSKLSQDAKQQATEQRSFWSKLLRGGFLKGMFMVTSSAFFHTFGFGALSGLSNMLVGVKKASPSTKVMLESIRHNRRKKVIRNVVGTQEAFSEDSMYYDRIATPSELNSVNLDLNEDTENRLPFVEILSSLNSDPKNLRSKQELANKFEEFRNNNFFETIDRRETQIDTVQTESKRPKTSDLGVSITIGDDFEGLFPEHDKDTIHYIHSKLFDPDSEQIKPERGVDKIIYRQNLAQEAREFLKTTTYNGLDIILDNGVNWKVLEILQNKFANNEKMSKLERIISDAAVFYMGGYMNDGGYDRDLIEEYEEATGKEAFVNNVPTESFKNWYDTKQVRSLGGRPVMQNKIDKLRQVIIEQLRHYSRTGEKLYSKTEVQAEVEYSHSSVKRNALIILEQIFIDPISSRLVYDMIFGRITTSYQKMKEECVDNGLILKTNPAQWFEMLKNRGETNPSRMFIEVQCTTPDKHSTSIRASQILTCNLCRIGDWATKPLELQNVLKLAEERNIQAISFKDDSQQLTEDEFNELVEAYKEQHQDPDDYKTGKLSFLNLKWKCLDCDRIFERGYNVILGNKIDHYCPSCISSIDAQITLEKAEDAFQGYITQSLRSNEQLYKFLPERILLMDEYQVISHPNCHVDVYGVISVAGKEFKIAIEHQGPQHYSFAAYLNLAKAQDLKRGTYKTDEQYLEDFSAQVERDRAKIELFKNLNKDGYYLIIVPYYKSPSERKAFILQEFIRQTKVNPSGVHIVDFL